MFRINALLFYDLAFRYCTLYSHNLLFAPGNRISLPFDFNTLKLSNALRCYGTWLSFLKQLVVVALHCNPLPKLGAGRILEWHDTVAELHLEFTQLFKLFVPLSAQMCSAVVDVGFSSVFVLYRVR